MKTYFYKPIWSLLSLVGLLLLASGQASADTGDTGELSSFVEQNISNVTAQACSDEQESSAGWEVQHLFLNISPYIKVGIHDVANVSFAPEIEFVWERVQTQ